MADATQSQTTVFSLRLTFEERAALERAAGDQALGAYIRSRLFDESIPQRRTRNKRPVKDQIELAKVLSALGHARISNNLNQLARAVNSGSLPVTPETETAIQSACGAVLAMRASLMAGLGLPAD
ncbi:MAG: plasmid mobilization relaxosome protein MobC [Rhodospirillaceae bacterium]|nr:plasmid mobilization relaxosome protein MobC [Rhodospirillaceae bacterium]